MQSLTAATHHWCPDHNDMPFDHQRFTTRCGVLHQRDEYATVRSDSAPLGFHQMRIRLLWPCRGSRREGDVHQLEQRLLLSGVTPEDSGFFPAAAAAVKSLAACRSWRCPLARPVARALLTVAAPLSHRPSVLPVISELLENVSSTDARKIATSTEGRISVSHDHDLDRLPRMRSDLWMRSQRFSSLAGSLAAMCPRYAPAGLLPGRPFGLRKALCPAAT
jgi:hypothetical protein